MRLFVPLFIGATALLFGSCHDGTSIASNSDSAGQSGTVKLPAVQNFIGQEQGKPVSLYYLKNKNGLQAAVTNYGARMVGLWVPDKDGKMTDVVVGFDSLSKFVKAGERFFGAVVGRYGNRVAKGTFSLDGKQYQLDLNNNGNTLHGGRTGFHSRVWQAAQPDSQTLVLTYVSADGEEGYPGTLTTKVTYQLTNDDAVSMAYEVSTDKKTIANITNHNFWNLNGEGGGTINNHELMIKAAKYTPVDSTLIPTGIEAVAGTPFDFTAAHKIGERVEMANTQLKYGKGYDHNFVLDKGITATPELIATIKGDVSGITMEVHTTEPGLQFYGGNFMEGKHVFKSGAKDDFRTAFCVETQRFPDSPNQPSFPTTVLNPGEMYKSVTLYKFKK